MGWATEGTALRRRVLALAPVAAVVAAGVLTGCGSTSKPSTSTTNSSPASGSSGTSSTSSASASGSSTTSSSASGGSAAASSAALTAPGTMLKAGQTAIVNFDTETANGNNGPSYKLAVTVESITPGSISDFNGISLTGVPKGDSPTYVRIKMSNISGKSFDTSNLDPADSVQAVDGNNLDSNLIITGYFAHCPDADTPSPFKAGQTFTTCETYMEKGEAKQIAYNGSSATLDSPIIWST